MPHDGSQSHSAPLPVFVAPGNLSDAPRLLLLSYHFPPDPTVGALRWYRMAPLLAERGWGLDVITVTPDDPSRLAASLAALPPGTRVYHVPSRRLNAERLEHAAWRVYRRVYPSRPQHSDDTAAAMSAPMAARKDSYSREELQWLPRQPRDLLRAYWAWAELARTRGWARAAGELATQIAPTNGTRAIVTTGPPHATHEGGCLAAERTGLPLVVDLRDPWSLAQSLPDHLASPVWLASARRGEARVMQRASLVVANTEPMRSAMARSYEGLPARFITVMNGWDDEPLPPTAHDHLFRIVYAGTLYLESDPRLFLRAFARVVRLRKLDPSRVSIEFIGAFGGPGEIDLLAIAGDEQVEDFVHVLKSRPRSDVFEHLARASLLVTFPGLNDALTIPAKTFECLRFAAWLLALTPPGSANAQVLAGTRAHVVAPDDVEGIARVLSASLDQWRAGKRPRASTNIAHLSRRAQTQMLVESLDELLGAAAPLGDASVLHGRVAAI